METWDEIRDEVAGMLADGEPIENVISKLHKTQNAVAKANLLKAIDEMKKWQMTNEVNSPCEHCGCNPKNGGSGLCNCTLACPKIT